MNKVLLNSFHLLENWVKLIHPTSGKPRYILSLFRFKNQCSIDFAILAFQVAPVARWTLYEPVEVEKEDRRNLNMNEW